MKRLLSPKINLPVMYLLEDSKELEDLPLGIPFIIGNEDALPYIIKYLEYTLLYRSAVATGLAFNWSKELAKLGYDSTSKPDTDFKLIPFDYMLNVGKPIEFDSVSTSEEFDLDIEDYLVDGYLVSFDKLTELNVTPSWLSNLTDSIKTNVLEAVNFNPNLYSKKLGVMSGYSEIVGSDRNLGILDFSGSIPVSIITTTAILAKLMSKTFYADIMITGSITKLFKYEELDQIDLLAEAKSIGRNNDQAYFKKLVSVPMVYNTVFSFGDNDHPGGTWKSGDICIPDEEGKKICNWKVNKVISLHTKSSAKQTGYTRWFEPKEIEHVKDWLVSLNE